MPSPPPATPPCSDEIVHLVDNFNRSGVVEWPLSALWQPQFTAAGGLFKEDWMGAFQVSLVPSGYDGWMNSGTDDPCPDSLWWSSAFPPFFNCTNAPAPLPNPLFGQSGFNSDDGSSHATPFHARFSGAVMHVQGQPISPFQESTAASANQTKERFLLTKTIDELQIDALGVGDGNGTLQIESYAQLRRIGISFIAGTGGNNAVLPANGGDKPDVFTSNPPHLYPRARENLYLDAVATREDGSLYQIPGCRHALWDVHAGRCPSWTNNGTVYYGNNVSLDEMWSTGIYGPMCPSNVEMGQVIDETGQPDPQPGWGVNQWNTSSGPNAFKWIEIEVGSDATTLSHECMQNASRLLIIAPRSTSIGDNYAVRRLELTFSYARGCPSAPPAPPDEPPRPPLLPPSSPPWLPPPCPPSPPAPPSAPPVTPPPCAPCALEGSVLRNCDYLIENNIMSCQSIPFQFSQCDCAGCVYCGPPPSTPPSAPPLTPPSTPPYSPSFTSSSPSPPITPTSTTMPPTNNLLHPPPWPTPGRLAAPPNSPPIHSPSLMQPSIALIVIGSLASSAIIGLILWKFARRTLSGLQSQGKSVHTMTLSASSGTSSLPVLPPIVSRYQSIARVERELVK